MVWSLSGPGRCLIRLHRNLSKLGTYFCEMAKSEQLEEQVLLETKIVVQKFSESENSEL